MENRVVGTSITVAELQRASLGEMPVHLLHSLRVPSPQVNSGGDIQVYKLCPSNTFIWSQWDVILAGETQE